MSVNEKQYEAAIPACCKYQTAKQHRDIIDLCWGLLGAIEDGKPMDCGECEFATRKAEENGQPLVVLV